MFGIKEHSVTLNPAMIILATYNVLHPFYSVEWAEQAGLNELAAGLSKEELRILAGDEENGWKKYSNWEERCPHIAKNIQLADIICLQEISKETLTSLLAQTPGYLLASEAYHPSRTPSREFGNAILYRKDKVHLVEAFQIQQGTTHAGRTAACAIFEMLGKKIKMASIHLSGYDPQERNPKRKAGHKKKGFQQLQYYVEELERDVEGIDGIVIAGDLNEDLSEASYAYYRPGYLTDCGYLWDQYAAQTEPSSGRRIDWLYYKPITSKSTFKLIPMQFEDKQLHASDHLMTGTAIEWKLM